MPPPCLAASLPPSLTNEECINIIPCPVGVRVLSSIIGTVIERHQLTAGYNVSNDAAFVRSFRPVGPFDRRRCLSR
ncbi:DNA-directed RNA polymerase, beta' subunit [Anopheles sinensis]|uniref:DNA-directed RNA polymerase, beta' subunit n=1 Tax=Anopheles sinensis TaxID=74873 RepID=A0A084V9T8_ANOSI|nr:DNA-directed RNA polymerase, beta' subunit [Anopheles sinensis]